MSIDPKIFRQVRKTLGLTQAELADALGLSRVTVNKMERGKLVMGIPDAIAERLLALKPRPAETNRFEDAARGRDPVKVNDDKHLWDNEEDES